MRLDSLVEGTRSSAPTNLDIGSPPAASFPIVRSRVDLDLHAFGEYGCGRIIRWQSHLTEKELGLFLPAAICRKQSNNIDDLDIVAYCSIEEPFD